MLPDAYTSSTYPSRLSYRPQTINTTLLPLTLKSHEKERARSEPIKQTQTSARRMHSLYTIPMGCGYLPGGCERYSVVNRSHDPRANDGLTIVKRGVKPTKHGGGVDTIIGHTTKNKSSRVSGVCTSVAWWFRHNSSHVQKERFCSA